MFEVKYITNEKGEKEEVVMNYSDYLELIEELEDLKSIAERRNDDLIAHDEVKSYIITNE